MKLSKIYSNKPDVFKTIEFEDGVNFILAEDHSVGKSTLFKLIDFCLFKSTPDCLKLEQFASLEFFLELNLGDGRFLTVKRPVSGRRNDCIKVTRERANFVELPNASFDFCDGETAAQIFFEKQWNFVLGDYRKYITYFLRDQDNQSDVFRLNKFQRSKDIDFKPVVANLLKIDGSIIRKKYELEDKIGNIEAAIKLHEQELGFYKTKEAVQEEINVYQKRLSEKAEQYDKFDFYLAEHNISRELVERVEQEIVSLNSKRNSLMREIEYIDTALKSQISISMDEIKGLFDEIKILFPDNLKRNYEGVVEFNRQITEERTEIFKENKANFQRDLGAINERLLSVRPN